MEIVEKVEVEMVVTKGQYILVYLPKYKKDFLVHFLIKKLVVPKGIPYGIDTWEIEKNDWLYSVNTGILFKNREYMFLQREMSYAILE